MERYLISDEGRHYLDAILPTFIYDRIADIRGSIKDVVLSENGDTSLDNTERLYFMIKSFLEKNKFGYSVDYVFIIDQKGIDLKNSGSLKAFEEQEFN
jgi:hypothetical protein